MSVKRPKAEVERRRWHFRYVPKAEVRSSLDEPSTASNSEVGMKLGIPEQRERWIRAIIVSFKYSKRQIF
jgi:hypothetical protein